MRKSINGENERFEFFALVQIPAQDLGVGRHIVVGGRARDIRVGYRVFFDAQLLRKLVELLK